MRIDLTTSGLQSPDSSGSGKISSPASKADNSDGTAVSLLAGDRAHLAFDSQRIQSFASQILSQPEIRAERVASLATAVASGTYSIDAAKTASAMISAYSGGAS